MKLLGAAASSLYPAFPARSARKETTGLSDYVADSGRTPSQATHPAAGAERDRGELRVLWVDDGIRADDAIVRLLSLERIAVEVAPTGSDGLRKAQTTSYGVIVLDLKLPDLFGMTVLRRLLASNVTTPVIVCSGCYLEAELDQEARALGAVVVHKPIDTGDLVQTLRNLALNSSGIGVPDTDSPHGIVGVSAAIREIISCVERIARSQLSVLLMGETGTGKEVVAQAIHRASPRRDRLFLPVNCGAIPEALFESELFGHCKGAFTGASEFKAGLLEEANRGTLFLDEVGEMPLSQQVRLLRFLDGGEVRRVGETRSRTMDVRVIAATNRCLKQEVSRGHFRSDLFYRLAAVSYTLPALRDRPDDIESLSRYWLGLLARQNGTRPITLGHGVLDLLRAHQWPGNVRELRNVLEQAWSSLEGTVLTQREVLSALGGASRGAYLKDADEKQRRAHVAWGAHQWNAKQAARSLGINRTTFYRWLGPGARRGKP